MAIEPQGVSAGKSLDLQARLAACSPRHQNYSWGRISGVWIGHDWLQLEFGKAQG